MCFFFFLKIHFLKLEQNHKSWMNQTNSYKISAADSRFQVFKFKEKKSAATKKLCKTKIKSKPLCLSKHQQCFHFLNRKNNQIKRLLLTANNLQWNKTEIYFTIYFFDTPLNGIYQQRRIKAVLKKRTVSLVTAAKKIQRKNPQVNLSEKQI